MFFSRHPLGPIFSSFYMNLCQKARFWDAFKIHWGAKRHPKSAKWRPSGAIRAYTRPPPGTHPKRAQNQPASQKTPESLKVAFLMHFHRFWDPPGLSFYDFGNNSGIVFCIQPNRQAPNSMQNTCRELANNLRETGNNERSHRNSA